MKLLHVISSLSPASGGPPEALRHLARAYGEAGVDVEIATQDDPGAPYLSSFSVPVHATGSKPSVYAYSPALLTWLRENVSRFDGLLINGVWTFHSLAVGIAARGRVPYVVFTHGMLDPWFRRNYPAKHLKKCLYWPAQYWVLRNAETVLFTSARERDLAPQSFWPNGWKSVVVPYGTGEPPANIEAQGEAWYSLAPGLAGRRYLLFLSRIHEKKGCDLLVQAFARIAADHPDLDLVIAGPDQVGLQAKLQRQAEQLGIAARIHWPGLLTGDPKWGALRNCEAFVLPSHQENFGVVVAEALACGRPVLISDQVNIWPEIEQEGVGLVAPDTLEGTEALLSRWLSLDRASRDAMAARATEVFRRRYSMRSCALAIRDLFATFNPKK
ncbi:MAG: glycosyltransferase [Silvibacterium sp.]|nr:glycosyltransferase [Silvibacterium sp.]